MPPITLRSIAGDNLEYENVEKLADVNAIIASHWLVPTECQQLVCDHCGKVLQRQHEDLDQHLLESGTLAMTMLVTVEAMIKDVSSFSTHKRKKGLTALGMLGFRGGDDSLDAVMKCLSNARTAEHDIRCAALETLTQVVERDDPRAFSAIDACLEDRDSSVRRAAIQALCKVTKPAYERAVDRARKLLEHSKLCVRRTAVELLIEIMGKDNELATSTVLELLSHEDFDVRCLAVQALSRVPREGAGRIIATACGLLESADRGIRRTAVEALFQVSSKNSDIVTALGHRLENQNDIVRLAAVRALGQVTARGDKRTVDVVTMRLEHQDTSVRHTAVDALFEVAGRTNDHPVSAVIGRLRHKSAAVRCAAVEALVNVATRGDGRAIAALVTGMQDGEAIVRRTAVNAVMLLAEKCDKHVISALSIRLDDADSSVRRAAVEAIMELAKGDKGGCTIVAIIACLDDIDPVVRRVAMEALTVLGGRGDQLLIHAALVKLDDEQSHVRCAALKALEWLAQRGDERVIDAAVARLGDGDVDVIHSALSTLMRVANRGDKRALAAANMRLESEDRAEKHIASEGRRWHLGIADASSTCITADRGMPLNPPVHMVSVMWTVLRRGMLGKLPMQNCRLRGILQSLARASGHCRGVVQKLQDRAWEHDLVLRERVLLPPHAPLSKVHGQEIIHIQVGQCGNNLGCSFWDSVLLDHGIDQTGFFQGDARTQLARSQVYFRELPSGKHVPRAILSDINPFFQDHCRTKYGSLFCPDNYIFGCCGAGGNWAKGHYTEGAELIETLLDAVRKETEACDSLQGFQCMFSLGGGTGSGLGTLALLKLRDEYPDRLAFIYSVIPSPKVSDRVIEPYNTILGMHQVIENADACVMLDNEALYNTCFHALKRPSPTYHDLNHVATGCLSSLTSCLRFHDTLKTNMRKLATSLIPFPRLHFLACSSSPVHPQTEGILQPCIGATDLMQQAVDGKNMVCAVDPRHGHYLAATLVLSGHVSGREIEQGLAALGNQGHMRSADWFQTCIGATACTGRVMPKGVPCECALIANNTAMQEVFQRGEAMFDALYRRKVFMHYYRGEGMDEMEFQEAQYNVLDLISDYQIHEDASMFSVHSSDEDGVTDLVERSTSVLPP